MICGGITMEEMSIQSMCACAASVRETSTSETTPSSIKISTTPGSPFRSDLALSICGRVMSPPSSRTLSTYSSLCCTWEECWSAQFTAKPLNFQRERIFGHRAVLTRWRLFYGHAFCEIAWFVDVPAQLNCQVVSEKLKRNDRQDGHYVLRRFRQRSKRCPARSKRFWISATKLRQSPKNMPIQTACFSLAGNSTFPSRSKVR